MYPSGKEPMESVWKGEEAELAAVATKVATKRNLLGYGTQVEA